MKELNFQSARRIIEKNENIIKVNFGKDYLEEGIDALRANNVIEAEKCFQKEVISNPQSYDGYIFLAEMNVNKGNYHQAINYFEQAEVKSADQKYEAKFGKAFCYLCIGEFSTALEIYENLETERPQDPSLLYFMGVSYKYTENYFLSLKYLKKALNYQRNDKILWELGTVYRYLNSPSSALDCFKSIVGVNPSNPRSYFGIGLIYSEYNEIESAEENFKKAIEIDNSFSDAHFELGRLYSRNGDYSNAVSALQMCISQVPLHLEAYFYLCNSLALQGKYREAVEFALMAERFFPENAKISLYTGIYYRSLEEYPQSVRCFKKALKFSEDKSLCYAELAQTYEEMGNPRNAEQYYNMILSQYPGYAKGYYLASRFYKKMNQIMKARKNIQIALQIQPDNPDYIALYGEILVKAGDHQKGIKEIERALINDPESVSLLLTYAYACKELKLWEKAYQAFSDLNCDDIDPVFMDLEKASVLNSMNLPQKALECLERVRILEPENKVIYLEMGRSYELLGDSPRAIYEIENYLSIEPNDVNIVYYLSLLYLRENKKDKVINLLKKAISMNPNYREPYQILSKMYIYEKEYGAVIRLLSGNQRLISENRLLACALMTAYQGIGEIEKSLEVKNTYQLGENEYEAFFKDLFTILV